MIRTVALLRMRRGPSYMRVHLPGGGECILSNLAGRSIFLIWQLQPAPDGCVLVLTGIVIEG